MWLQLSIFAFATYDFDVISKKSPRPMPRNFSRIFYSGSFTVSGVIFKSLIHKGSISLFLYVDTQFPKPFVEETTLPPVHSWLSLFLLLLLTCS